MKYLGKMPALREIEFYWSNPESIPFSSALCTLRDRAKYHHHKLLQCINDPVFEKLARDWVTRKTEDPYLFMDRQFQLGKIIDPELAAMFQALRYQFDIFAQIINVELLDSPKERHSLSVAFKKIGNFIPESKLKSLIEQIKEDSVFVYLDEFVNTTKHVMVPGVNSWSANGDEERMISGTRISEFQRQNTIAEKDLVWAVEDVKPWVDQCIKNLTAALKESQIKKLNDSGEEWNSQDFLSK